MAETVLDLVVHELTLADFRKSIRAAVRALWKGIKTQAEFIRTMQITLDRGFEQAWREGAIVFGITPKDRTIEEDAAKLELLLISLNHLVGFAAFIYENRKGISKLSKVLNRAEIWVNRYNEVRNLAIQMAGTNQKLEWVVGPTEHCSDCLKLNGRVNRASVWEKNEIRPRMSTLECGGFRCQCELKPTQKKGTPGRLPIIR